MSGDDLGEVILEVTTIGDVQRVAAIHVASGAEVVIQAPAGAALADVRALALRKLQRALEVRDRHKPSRPGKWV